MHLQFKSLIAIVVAHAGSPGLFKSMIAIVVAHAGSPGP